jgi:hypothetical protein
MESFCFSLYFSFWEKEEETESVICKNVFELKNRYTSFLRIGIFISLNRTYTDWNIVCLQEEMVFAISLKIRAKNIHRKS